MMADQALTTSSAHLAWFASATVRTTNLDAVNIGAAFEWQFPVEMKPLLGHPELQGLPLSARKFIHVQAYHKYLHDVCLTETDVVNRVATAIAYGRSAAVLPADMAAEAFSVLVDEAFHSYAARLFSMHVTRATGIEPLPMPVRNALVNAYEDVPVGGGEDMVAMSQLLCCCLSESTFTKEILAASRLEGYDEGFHSLMAAHLADEGRHYSYFRRVLACYWTNIDDHRRDQVAALLPNILTTYFDDSDDDLFDSAVLIAAGVAADTAAAWLNDVACQRPAISDRPRVRNSIEFLRLAGVLSYPAVQQSLNESGLLC